jgi:hypothetical protein
MSKSAKAGWGIWVSFSGLLNFRPLWAGASQRPVCRSRGSGRCGARPVLALAALGALTSGPGADLTVMASGLRFGRPDRRDDHLVDATPGGQAHHRRSGHRRRVADRPDTCPPNGRATFRGSVPGHAMVGAPELDVHVPVWSEQDPARGGAPGVAQASDRDLHAATRRRPAQQDWPRMKPPRASQDRRVQPDSRPQHLQLSGLLAWC